MSSVDAVHWTGSCSTPATDARRQLLVPPAFEDFWRFATASTLAHSAFAWLDPRHDRAPRMSRCLQNSRSQVAHGEGQLRGDKGGVLYSGTMNQGFRHGQGVAVIWEITDGLEGYVGEYAGQWQWGARHGYGKVTSPDGSTSEGQWQYDRLHGAGIEVDPVGGVFVGCFVRGRRHGSGTYQFPDGQLEVRDYTHGLLVRARDGTVESPARALVDKLRAAAPALPAASAASSSSSSSSSALQDATSQGAAEELPTKGAISLTGKRMLKRVQDEVVPCAAQQLALVLPGVKLEVDADSFIASAHGNIAAWTLANYQGLWVFTPLVKAFEQLAKDAEVAAILKSSVKAVRIVNDDKASALQSSLAAGTLTLTNAFSAGEDSKLTVSALVAKIEAAV